MFNYYQVKQTLQFGNHKVIWYMDEREKKPWTRVHLLKTKFKAKKIFLCYIFALMTFCYRMSHVLVINSTMIILIMLLR